MIPFFRSSTARFSLSFEGVGTSVEMRKLENILANAASTACRWEARELAFLLSSLFCFLLSDKEDDDDMEEFVIDRDLRRKLPPVMKAAEEAGVGGDGFKGLESSRADSVCGPDTECLLSSEDFFECEWRDDDDGGGMGDTTGATSLAIRASIKVTKVKETL